MGKYMNKPKITAANVLHMDYSAVDGVCTRAKSLTLKRNIQSSDDDSSSYLELRSHRRLKKVFSVSHHHQIQKPITSPIKQISQLINSPVARSSPFRTPTGSRQNSVTVGPNKGFEASSENKVATDHAAAGFEASTSTGDGNLKFLTNERVTRGSTYSHEANHRSTPTAFQRDMPSFHELEAFFAAAEREQQRKFMKKYNFDIVTEKPIPGGYEWFRIRQ